ncbi:MAG TPA: YabP/YqfC family sporulation protein [Candidatus Copromorpha excrementigallinarum]|uniref:YabP/YqfC family sporulation protein n=1 Tax=Candidatus Allocopromorpha excrementigallinarum TaxID=2840742 RepID=A0A9D1HYT4_9FIRM|nr:YabP/YqfC family sporulation protein [Candidatus Copromorpha excrementigallinarum]
MDIKEELLFDFAVNIPRVLVAGNTTVLDNVKRLMMLTDTQIVVSNGRRYTSVKGRDFVVSQLKEERMLVKGEVEEIRFFTALQEDKG